MDYKERLAAVRSMARCNPELTDRELSIMLDAAFSEDEEETL